MALTKLNSLAIPPDTVVDSDISFPLDSASFTGDLTVDTNTLVVDSTNNRVGINTSNPDSPLSVLGDVQIEKTSAGILKLKRNDTVTATGNGIGQIQAVTNEGGTDAVVALMRFEVGDTAGTDGEITLETGGSERFRVDSSGNVGIGTSPSAKLHVDNTAATHTVATFNNQNASFNTDITLNHSSATGNFIVSRRTNGEAWFYQSAAQPIAFFTNSGERMRIDSSGNLLVGKTSADLNTAGGEIRANGQIGAVVNSTPFFANRTNGDGSLMDFYISNTFVGKIKHTGGTVSIAQSSDARLKKNVLEISGCLDQIKQIRPVSWDWNSREGGSIGVVAQEIQQIWPDVVDEGDDGYLTVAGISRVEARLIKAIQEQQAMIETLQAQVAELQGAN